MKKVILIFALILSISSCSLLDSLFGDNEIRYVINCDSTDFILVYSDSNGNDVTLTHNEISMPYTLDIGKTTENLTYAEIDLYDGYENNNWTIELYVNGDLIKTNKTYKESYNPFYEMGIWHDVK